ncbi:MAG: glycosyltransferase, partial [Patescibacteria group bacterium]
VFTYHSQYDHIVKSFVPFFPDWLYELIFYVGTASVIGNMAAIIAPSKWLQRELKEKFPEIPIYYVSTAGLPRPFALNTSAQKLRVQLSLPLYEPLFIIVSRLSNEKNVAFVVTAFTKWASSHEKGKLLIIGDGNSRGDLEQLVTKLRITKRVVFTGSIPNPSLAPWLNAADIFLYSSTTDTVSINVIEAMSAGLPIVAIDDKSTREIISHGINGYVSPPRIDTFVSYMSEALQHKTTLSRGAREQSRKYALSITSTALVKTYEQIIKHYQSSHH